MVRASNCLSATSEMLKLSYGKDVVLCSLLLLFASFICCDVQPKSQAAGVDKVAHRETRFGDSAGTLFCLLGACLCLSSHHRLFFSLVDCSRRGQNSTESSCGMFECHARFWRSWNSILRIDLRAGNVRSELLGQQRMRERELAPTFFFFCFCFKRCETTITEEDSHLIVASDGIWNVISYDDVVNLVCSPQYASHSATALAKILVEKALRTKARDNLSIVVRCWRVFFFFFFCLLGGFSHAPTSLCRSSSSERQAQLAHCTHSTPELFAHRIEPASSPSSPVPALTMTTTEMLNECTVLQISQENISIYSPERECNTISIYIYHCR